MHISPQEQQALDKVSSLLAPTGTMDHSVLNKYLARFQAVHDDYGSKNGDQLLLGALLKQADAEQNKDAFVAYYKAFRSEVFSYDDSDDENDDASSLEKQSPAGQEKEMPLDAWLHDMSVARAADLALWLRHTSANSTFTHQALILRDAKKWLPKEDMASFVPKEVLDQKVSVLFKNFEPDRQDLPYLVDAGLALSRHGPTQKHKELGDTLMRCSFFSEYDHQREYMDKYTSEACPLSAFALIQHTELVNDYPRLIAQTQARLKKPTTTFDALAFCVAVLQNERSSDDEKARANALAVAILDAEQSKDPTKRHKDSATQALCAVYNESQDPTTKKRIVDYFTERVHSIQTTRFFETHLNTLIAHSPALLDNVLAEMQSRVTPQTWDFIVGKLSPTPPNAYHSEYINQIGVLASNGGPIAVPYRITPLYAESSGHFFKKLSGPVLLSNLVLQLHPEKSDRDLNQLFEHLAKQPWSQEQMDHVKQSTWPATAVLYYLYQASQTGEALDDYADGSLPNTQWQPLPLMNKLYPEHAGLWRQMELGILDAPLNDNKDEQFSHIMGKLFDVFAQGFSSEKMTLSLCKGLISGLGMEPLDYFQANTKTSLPTFELPDDMFNFS